MVACCKKRNLKLTEAVIEMRVKAENDQRRLEKESYPSCKKGEYLEMLCLGRYS